MREGTIVEGRGGLYTVRDGAGTDYVLRAKKKFRRQNLTPLVGDRVCFLPGSLEEHGWLEEILPRTFQGLRPPVANVSLLVVVLAPEPAPDLLLADKLLVTAFGQGITPLIAVNKQELDAGLAPRMRVAYAPAGVPVLAVSAATGEGLDALSQALSGHLSCFAGQSGAGKSTLISRLTGRELVSGAISPRIRRGRQTTRHITLIEERGLRVLDTPGFSLLETPDDLEPQQLARHYPEFEAFLGQCRFDPCLHDREPGCAVAEAVSRGALDAGRVERYRELLAQTKEKWSTRYD